MTDTRPPPMIPIRAKRGTVKAKKEARLYLRLLEGTTDRVNTSRGEAFNQRMKSKPLWGKSVVLHGALSFTFTGTLEPFGEGEADRSAWVNLRINGTLLRIPKGAVLAVAEVD